MYVYKQQLLSTPKRMSPHAVSMKDEPTDEAVDQVNDTPTGVNAVLYKYA